MEEEQTAQQDGNSREPNYSAQNYSDGNGNPTGGFFRAKGIDIQWQNGPLGCGPSRREPNGAFVETVIEAAFQRIQYYQNTKFACMENDMAMVKLEEALHWLNARTKKRYKRGVEGTHIV